MPAWADAAWQEFAKRFPPELRLELKEIKAQGRAGQTAESCKAAEAQRAAAACLAMSFRSPGDKFSALALPPFEAISD